MEEGEQVGLVCDHIFHVHFKNEVAHGWLSATFEVLLKSVDHSEEGRAALVDEPKEDQPRLEGEGLVRKDMFHSLFGQDFSHFRFQGFSVQTRGMAVKGHEKFFMCKMPVDAPLETTFQGFGVFVVLGSKQRIHVCLDQIIKDHVER